MTWKRIYLKEALKDMKKLSGSEREQVIRVIKRVSTNPLPANEGGYGKPLGNKNGNDLTGLLKIKLKKAGIRIVYTLVRTEIKMIVVVVGVRADNEVYETAGKRMGKYGLNRRG